MSNSDKFYAQTFESFSQIEQIFEDSNLSKMGLPKAMITKIHTKEEHESDKYPKMGHTYKGGTAIPMPYRYFIPSDQIEIPEPIKLRGRKTSTSPFTGKEVKSEYTDLAWFLESIPLGENRVFIVNPELNFFMMIYHKQSSKGATGQQYAIMSWDADRRKVVDFGYSELTTRGVDLGELRGVHNTKGGNTNGKVQEYIRAATRGGAKKYAPTLEKPLWVYVLPVDKTGTQEPRATREERGAGKSSAESFIKVFAAKLDTILPKLNSSIKDKLKLKLTDTEYYGYSETSQNSDITNIAKYLEVNPNSVEKMLHKEFATFRQELFEEGRGRVKDATSKYAKTSGFDLEKDEKASREVGKFWSYRVSTKGFAPDEEEKNAEGFREAQPEKYKRDLPLAGEYASIPSMIKQHTLDGLIDKFLAFLVTGKIKTPNVSLAASLGVGGTNMKDEFIPASSNTVRGKEPEEEENYLF
jgi:hypothetical protein